MKKGEEMQSGICTHLCLGDWWVRMLWKSLRSQFNVKICKLAVNRVAVPQTSSLGDLKVRNMWERNSGEKKMLQNVCKWWLILSGMARHGESSWDLLVCYQFRGHLRALGLAVPFTLRSCEQSAWHTTAKLNTDAVLLLLPLEMYHWKQNCFFLVFFSWNNAVCNSVDVWFSRGWSLVRERFCTCRERFRF